MGKVLQSLMTVDHTIRGVCYDRSNYLNQSIAELTVIPPERVGLSGEYDHYGLAKRVKASCHCQFGRDVVKQLVIKQRGSAVILSGQVEDLTVVDQLVHLALQAEGATHVEVNIVQLDGADRSQPVQVA
ncbi:BON domain-containing protein [Nodosilinea sp. LEGE 07088]|uniref:BON domain-containing protein n=1 Tax=Nodosilinea sp. LEGE 07088 TaxID=2777968 RepID=UPI00187DFF32|nr:BON domain-containing protein [Nodosilinea sp. LEGE 07088]MBE9141060.1 BON domain-containing protein [Nodosilinea sp. LEGE 07088]